MKISAKIDYACRALLELSLHWPNETPLPITEIAHRRRIPIKFLTHILLVLKQQGFVESVRGKTGGYTLIKSPKEITLGDLVQNFPELRFSSGEKKARKNTQDNVFESIWQELDNEIAGFTNRISFEDISNRERALYNVPSYTI